jgi:hypothetical protein
VGVYLKVCGLLLTVFCVGFMWSGVSEGGIGMGGCYLWLRKVAWSAAESVLAGAFVLLVCSQARGGELLGEYPLRLSPWEVAATQHTPGVLSDLNGDMLQFFSFQGAQEPEVAGIFGKAIAGGVGFRVKPWAGLFVPSDADFRESYGNSIFVYGIDIGYVPEPKLEQRGRGGVEVRLSYWNTSAEEELMLPGGDGYDLHGKFSMFVFQPRLSYYFGETVNGFVGFGFPIALAKEAVSGTVTVGGTAYGVDESRSKIYAGFSLFFGVRVKMFFAGMEVSAIPIEGGRSLGGLTVAIGGCF